MHARRPITQHSGVYLILLVVCAAALKNFAMMFGRVMDSRELAAEMA